MTTAKEIRRWIKDLRQRRAEIDKQMAVLQTAITQ